MNFEVKLSRDFEALGELTIQEGCLRSVGASSEEEVQEAVKVMRNLPSVFMSEARLDDKLVGVLLFLPYSGCDFDIHVIFAESCRGDFAIEASKKMLFLVFSQTMVQRLVGRCPSKHVSTFAKQCGFREFGHKDGLILVELTKVMFNNQTQEEVCRGLQQ